MDTLPPAVLFLLPISVVGLATLGRQIARRGGAVRTEAFRGPELALALVLAGFFALLAWLSFFLPHPPVTAIDVRAIWRSEMLNVVLVLGVLLFLTLRHLRLRETFGVTRWSLFRTFVYALGWILLVLPLVTTIMALVSSCLPKQEIEEQLLVAFFRSEVRQHHYSGIVSIVITAAVLAPSVEEFLFRGYLYPVFKRFLTPWGSAILTALLFAFLHGNVAALAGLFALALCLTAAYEWSGSLLVPIGMHALFNGLTLLVVYLGAVHPHS